LQAFETKLQAAEASVAEDRKRILNTIAGGAPDGAAADADGAHKEHANYEKLNDVLRGRFAAAPPFAPSSTPASPSPMPQCS